MSTYLIIGIRICGHESRLCYICVRLRSNGIRLCSSGVRQCSAGLRLCSAGLRLCSSGLRLSSSGVRLCSSGIRLCGFCRCCSLVQFTVRWVAVRRIPACFVTDSIPIVSVTLFIYSCIPISLSKSNMLAISELNNWFVIENI